MWFGGQLIRTEVRFGHDLVCANLPQGDNWNGGDFAFWQRTEIKEYI